MKNLCILFIAFVTTVSFGQKKDYASLEKNFNAYAKDLSHDLNKTKDTLLLKSDKPLRFIYSINKDYKREIDTYAGRNNFNIPLDTLTQGKHVFVVTQSSKRIIFVVHINGIRSPKIAAVKTGSDFTVSAN